MSLRHLCDKFDSWRNASREMVLATVTATVGSTYSKPGAQMLIADGKDHQGLLSGGCLEGDLMLRAQSCLADGKARHVTYDMRNRSEDEIWGLGLGCDGALDILLQPLSEAYNWEPLSTIASAARRGQRAVLALVVNASGTAPDAWPGASLVLTETAPGHASIARASRQLQDQVCPRSWEALHARCLDVMASGTREQIELQAGDDGVMLTVLITPINRPLRLLVLGAGPDTLPLLRMARELGWYVTQADHRPASLAAAARQAPVDSSLEVIPGQLGASLDADQFDAVVVMTHHLASDRHHLAELARSQVPFIGLLGPAARRRRLLADVTATLSRDGKEAAGLRDARGLMARTHGPVGLDLGARDPAGIAMSILAQVQQFHARNG